MKLVDAKRMFFQLRSVNRIEVCENHILEDHHERGFSVDEVLSLVKSTGLFQDTTDLRYLGERFYWRTKDLWDNDVRLVIEFEEDDLGKFILVVSAGEPL